MYIRGLGVSMKLHIIYIFIYMHLYKYMNTYTYNALLSNKTNAHLAITGLVILVSLTLLIRHLITRLLDTHICLVALVLVLGNKLGVIELADGILLYYISLH